MQQRPEPGLVHLTEGDLVHGRYRIESLTRVWGPGAHYAATDLQKGVRVSLHLLRARPLAHRSDEDAARAWFLAGAGRARTLESPHVARVLDAGITSDGHPWVVREHLASMTLAAHLERRGPLPIRDAVDIAIAVADALAEAHSRGLVHGGLGPHAVHVAWSAAGLSEIKLTGAGTAAAEEALTLGSARDSILRAPEQLRQRAAIDPRTDVWALGALFHTMIAGKPPFQPDTSSGASLAVLLSAPPSLTGIPKELIAITLRSLARDPEARPRSVLDVADVLAFHATAPEFARERIAERRPSLPPKPDTHPTRVVERDGYVALAREREAAGHPLPAVLVDATVVRPLEAPPARPRNAPAPRRSPKPELTYVITRRATSFPRRRIVEFLGGFAAAACVALLVLLGMDGGRGSPARARPEPLALAIPAANASPEAALAAPPVPVPSHRCNVALPAPEKPGALAGPSARGR